MGSGHTIESRPTVRFDDDDDDDDDILMSAMSTRQQDQILKTIARPRPLEVNKDTWQI